MAVTATPVFPQTPKNYKVQILPADTTTLKTVATGGANGTKISALNAASTDTSARDVQIGITRGGVFFILGTITVAIGAGNAGGTPSANLLTAAVINGLPLDSDGNPYILLADASDTLQVKSIVTVTTAKEIDVVAMGADF